MKARKIIIGAVLCLSLVLTGQAATLTTLDWQFPTFANPSGPTVEVNPSGGTATATFVGPNNAYTFGSGEFGLYGTPTGLWDIQGGQLQLAMDRTATSLVDYTLELTQFIDSGNFFPGTVSFSIPNTVFIGRTPVEPQTGIMVGSWVRDTYQWSSLSIVGPISLNISPGAGSGQLFLDEVKLSIAGDLTIVPEPTYSQIAAAGLLAFGIVSWFRSKRNG